MVPQLQCYLFPSQAILNKIEWAEFYNSAYHLWKQTMDFALKNESKITEAEILYSDEFIRQREFICLFDDAKPVGIYLFNWFDLHYQCYWDLSYYQNYPKELMKILYEDGHRHVMITNNMCVHPDYRKHKIGLGVSEILFSLANLRFLESNATVLTGFTRNDRKTNEALYRHGASTLIKDYLTHGILSDAIAIYRQNATLSSDSVIAERAFVLWKSKISTRIEFTIEDEAFIDD